MELENVIDFLRNKSILITGASGFLGKVLVEKILRVQPNVKKLYLLIRAKNNKPELERLNEEILNKDLFRLLREGLGGKFDSFISEKVIPINGDTSLPNLGMDTDKLCKEIDAIIHVTASTRFNERYDFALGINTLGAKNMVNFAKKCLKLQILVHVSTAYVCGEAVGLISEKPYEMGKTLNGRHGLDIEEEKMLIDNILNNLKNKGASTKEIQDAMKHLGQQRARLYGWPNTYVFTKAMGEMLINVLREHLPVIIVRPTMICSSYKEPFSGWIEGSGSAAAATIIYGKGIARLMYANSNSVFDMIPVDMVVNSIIAAMVANAKKSSLTVYHVGSSLRNPITLDKLMDINFLFFKKNPWSDGQSGKPEEIRRIKLVKSKVFFFVLLGLQLLNLMVLKLMDLLSCGSCDTNVDRIWNRLKATVKVAEIFGPYILFAGIFDDNNMEKIRIAMGQNDKDKGQLSLDPKCIDWEDYLFNVHIPATIKYMF